ncbi:response regulator [Cohnella sp. LGH]|uniref:Circadian input-output histidine kinase CikA n=1 Tax=Cohnella phaseoli TaxID=456490 RepID=A0A3D9I4D5_9BACL|nr:MULTISPECIES: ATP-binding protein [Cohnella]QTH40247.1 response regulator [Cohnella sp. LGH]RED56510.1 PAS/PAC sensor hybrid histidine kinase [Cohnella phaseoli]
MPERHPVSLLIVDDHIENLLAMEATLGGEGYRLVRAQSGEEALRHLLREDFAVIVMDVQMPGMDGFETARLIKARDRSKHIPILFITATSKEIVHQFEGYSTGAIDYLIKPVTASIVKAKIGALVRLYRSNRELERQRTELHKRTEELEAVNREMLRVTYSLSTEEAKSRMIFDTSIDGMFTFDDTGTVQSANPAMGRLFGYPATRMIGFRAEDLLPRFAEMQRPASEEDGAGYLTGVVREMPAVRSTGVAFEAEIQLGEAVINQQRLFACTVRDITERKGTLRQLTEAKNIAERASRAKSEFLAMMSHEMRTPLNALLGVADLLMDFPFDERHKAFPRAIKDNADRLLTIVNDLLEYTRLESGKEEFDSQPFSVSDTIGQIVADYSEEADRKSLLLNLAVDSLVPQYVRGDPAKYAEIVRRLVDNAIKFTEKGRIDVFIGVDNVERQEAEPIRLSVAVEDTGIGIPEDQLERLFLPFSQIDSSLARQFEGLGLGLAMCQSLAKAMGGEIRLEAKEGAGSRFVCVVAVEPFYSAV